MEIIVQGENSLKIKGKNASISVNPTDKNASYNAAILLNNPTRSSLALNKEAVVIDGPGEYETGGIKISGTRAEGKTVYSLTVDDIAIILGDIKTLEKLHQKMKEHNIALLYAPEEGNVSYVSSLATNALLFYGAKAPVVIDTLAKDEKKVIAKYQVTLQKLPEETETILLASS